MEMQEVTKEGERNKKDERVSELTVNVTEEGERDEEGEGASEPMLEVKTKEEAEPDHYSKLQSPSEDVYSEAFYGSASVKTRAGKQPAGNSRLYRAACLFLTIICLVLLLVIIILSVKLQTGSTVCPERQKSSTTCSHKECQALFPSVQPQRLGCQQCADGWLTFGRSCFYLSTLRLSWEESQRNCTSRGGALAVVNSQGVQNFLTKKGKMKYWIGLRDNGDSWTWVNKDVLRQSYWAGVTSEGDCGILSSENSPDNNWIKAPCQAYTYFICQVEL